MEEIPELREGESSREQGGGCEDEGRQHHDEQIFGRIVLTLPLLSPF
jgi:hypothetical protein